MISIGTVSRFEKRERKEREPAGALRLQVPGFVGNELLMHFFLDADENRKEIR